MTDSNRRPLTSRNHPLAQRIAAHLATHKILTPNQISVLSIVCAALGAAMLAWLPHPLILILVALMVQLRLLCNLFDGMVAVEGGLKTPSGDLYNELPDRVSDSLLFIALGYACAWPALGWCAALLAGGTAYIRVFGGSLGLAQSYRGPLAKQQRMAVLTLACLFTALTFFFIPAHYPLRAALLIILIGSALTCYLRIRDIVVLLKARQTP